MRKTKIVATISGSRCEVDFIRSLYEAGMNVVRINSAHVSIEEADRLVDNVRKVSDTIGILIDTKGPEIRTTKCEIPEGIPVRTGDIIKVKGGESCDITNRDTVYVNNLNIVADVPVGAFMLIDDGDIALEITGKGDGYLTALVGNDGAIKGRKSVNVPNVHISLPSVTERDKTFIEWAAEKELDFLAHSFVRTKDDVLAVQEILDRRKSHIKIISKIENQQGVDNLDEILEYSYGIMVARGDLGVEIPAEQIPVIQRNIVNRCMQRKKPVIIATQMLQSMITNPRPTRAEVSDIANAIFQRTDAIMLSGETAQGAYPVEAVLTMDRIALEIEKNTEPIIDINLVRIDKEITAQLARSAVKASVTLPVQAIIIDTLTGRTGRYLSAFRGQKIVYAVCYRKHVMRELSLSYGIYAEYIEQSFQHKDFLCNILRRLEENGTVRKKDLVVVVGGDSGAVNGATFLEINTLENIQRKHIITE